VKIETNTSEPFTMRPPRDRNLHMTFFKILLINVIVLCGLFFSLEFSYRVWQYFRSCDTICYNTAFFTKLDAFNRSIIYGYLAPDPITGYSPADGAFVIREPGWNNAMLTIRKGVRVNRNIPRSSPDGAILAVGDSFVFGDQVSDNETWPSILERRLNRRVVNGGVPGYGTVQAVLRAEHLLKAEPYSLVILSILVNVDLSRDRVVSAYPLVYRPVVIREGGRLRQTTVEESHRIISGNFLCAYPWVPEFFFWSHIAKRFFSPLGYDGRCATVVHPKAATVDEIIEFVLERFAALPIRKVILLQYPRYAIEGFSEPMRLVGQAIDQAERIREAASRHGVPVIDTYDTLKKEPPRETYIYSNWWPHHSKRGNEVIGDLIAGEIAVLAP
jgi:GDSL-like lipase/acylhydrolase family protein